MARIFKNKTSEDVEVKYNTIAQVIPANSQADLEDMFEHWQLAASSSLIELLGQGTDKYQLNDGSADLSVTKAIDLLHDHHPTTVAITTAQTASDGSPFVTPCIFPAGVYLYFTSAGDGTQRGNGQAFLASSDTAGDTVVEWSFCDVVLLAGASANFAGAEHGDYATLEVFAPATSVVANGTNTGNCNVVSGVIVPAANDGAYDVDLSAAVPVPAQTSPTTYNGYWDMSAPLIGRPVVTPSATPGSARWHLLTVEQVLVRYANRLQILGSHYVNFSIPAIEPKSKIPQWKGRLTMHNSGHTGLKLSWTVILGRALTVGAVP
jgi:hypothetical protein